MSDDKHVVTDDLRLSELTVGEFKQLIRGLLAEASSGTGEKKIEPPIEKVPMRRKSLDEFMNDLD